MYFNILIVKNMGKKTMARFHVPLLIEKSLNEVKMTLITFPELLKCICDISKELFAVHWKEVSSFYSYFRNLILSNDKVLNELK